MKPISLFIHAVLALVLLAAAPAGAAPRDPGEAAVLRRLAAPEAARVFKQYNAAHGQKIQHHLAQIYGQDKAYVADAGGAMRPLDDSIVGPVTLKWLTRFCRDYGIVAGDPNFEQDVVASLEQVAEIARVHKDWVKILFSAEFDDWINGQPTPERVRIYKYRRSGAAPQVNALIEEYLKAQRPVPAGSPSAPLELTYAFDPARPGTQGNLKLVGELLKPLAKQPAKGEDAFSDDVIEALDGVTIDDDTLPLIKRYSRTDRYVLSSDLLDRLPDEGMSELAVEGLRPLARGQQFADLEPFEAAIAEAAKVSQAKDEILSAKRRIVSEARVTRYQIPVTLAADLAASDPLAPVLADLFAGIAKVEYPTKELFDKAQEWQVRRALGMCMGARRDAVGRLGDEQLDLLAHALPAAAKASEGIRALREVNACSVDQQLDANEYAYHVYVEAAAQLDRKMQLQFVHRAAPPRGAGWAMPGCQCGNGEHDGMVYGFLPLWLDTAGAQVDFGVLSRIGLYGLTADDEGVLRAPAGFPGKGMPDALAALMRDAHRHNVKVDWVIGRSDWDAFSRANKAGKAKVFVKLRERINAWLNQPLQGDSQALVRLTSLWMDQGAVAGDGVALYFRGFPAADKALLKEFVVNLSADLEHMQPKRRLSIIVDQATLGKEGPYGYSDLMDMISQANKIEGGNTPENRKLMVKDIPVLVMLNEPTQQSKKALRGRIQDALHGMESMRLLRSIVTVVEYDRVSSQQLTDDIIYAGDNYYGIGFWPLPLAGAAGTNEVSTLLAKNFHPVDGNGEAWDRLVGLLCPWRLWARGAFWLTLLMAIGAGIGYFSCSGCNKRIDSSGVYFTATLVFIALPLIPLFVLTVSDPVLAPYQSLITLLFAAGCLVVAVGVTRHNFIKSRRKLP
jgi:hypothetical protein